MKRILGINIIIIVMIVLVACAGAGDNTALQDSGLDNSVTESNTPESATINTDHSPINV